MTYNAVYDLSGTTKIDKRDVAAYTKNASLLSNILTATPTTADVKNTNTSLQKGMTHESSKNNTESAVNMPPNATWLLRDFSNMV